MTNIQIETLLQKYVFGSATASEVNELANVLEQNEHNEVIKNLLIQVAENSEAEKTYDDNKLEGIIQKIIGVKQTAAVISIRRKTIFIRVAAASIIMLLLSVS